jgi:hypothetical protein
MPEIPGTITLAETVIYITICKATYSHKIECAKNVATRKNSGGNNNEKYRHLKLADVRLLLNIVRCLVECRRCYATES